MDSALLNALRAKSKANAVKAEQEADPSYVPPELRNRKIAPPLKNRQEHSWQQEMAEAQGNNVMSDRVKQELNIPVVKNPNPNSKYTPEETYQHHLRYINRQYDGHIKSKKDWIKKAITSIEPKLIKKLNNIIIQEDHNMLKYKRVTNAAIKRFNGKRGAEIRNLNRRFGKPEDLNVKESMAPLLSEDPEIL